MSLPVRETITGTKTKVKRHFQISVTLLSSGYRSRSLSKEQSSLSMKQDTDKAERCEVHYAERGFWQTQWVVNKLPK